MEALIVLSAVAAGAAGLWAVKALSRRAERARAIAEQTHEINIAELVVMAMLADGKLTKEEWSVIRREFGEHGYSLLEADKVIGRLRDDAEQIRARGELGRWVREQGADLCAADRELVYEMVVEMSLTGTTLSSPSGEYRSAEDGAPKTLLGLFGDGLMIPEARQREINLAHLRAKGSASET